MQIGRVHLNLFTGPGFTVKNVLIDDDPAAGIEPFAHVESMQARVRWLSLLRGKLAFSSLRMDSPSVNLVKTAGRPVEHSAAARSHLRYQAPAVRTICRTSRSATAA